MIVEECTYRFISTTPVEQLIGSNLMAVLIFGMVLTTVIVIGNLVHRHYARRYQNPVN